MYWCYIGGMEEKMETIIVGFMETTVKDPKKEPPQYEPVTAFGKLGGLFHFGGSVWGSGQGCSR